MSEYKEPLVDVAVLLIFFSRPEQFSEVFKQVKKARPSKLFLYQDGPRAGREDDVSGIEACRKIAEEIDWKCDVHTLYQEKNYGCDPSEYIAQKWAFSHVDKCIILEDDDVPSCSFFQFCKEMLDKYEFDERISMISGFNHEEITPDVPYDYFFTSNCSIWGWASWKRVIDQWDGEYNFLNDEYGLRKLESIIGHRNYLKNFINMCNRHKETGREHYETILIANVIMSSGLCIVPTRNMINNIGDTADSTHFTGSSNTIPRGLRRIFTMKRYEIEFPISHPKYIMEDMDYKDRVYKIMGWGHPLIKMYRLVEGIFHKIRAGESRSAIGDIKSRINNYFEKTSY